jgi:hypothetical protein
MRPSARLENLNPQLKYFREITQLRFFNENFQHHLILINVTKITLYVNAYVHLID